jgi:serine/threonine protein kinase
MFNARRAMEAYGHPLSTLDIVALAITEYLERVDSGEAIDIAVFTAGFPEVTEALLHSIGRLAGNSTLGYPRIGDSIAGQTILRYLSLSAESQVFLARDMRLDGLPTVLKMTHAKSREPVFLARLHHQAIVRLLKVEDTVQTGRTVLTLEYCGDSTLVQKGRPIRSLQPLLSVAKAIQHAHKHGVIHNDVCSRNVVFRARNATLIDFNAAVLIGEHGAHRPISSLSQLTVQSLHELLANSHFISPCDEAIDNFAFIVFCYHVLAGSVPWGDSTAFDESSCRAALSARENLALEHLDHQNLTRAERQLFFALLSERERCPRPVDFIKRLNSVRRWRTAKHALSAVCSIGLLATVVASSFRSGELNTVTAAVEREPRSHASLRSSPSHFPLGTNAVSVPRTSDTSQSPGSHPEGVQASFELDTEVLSSTAAECSATQLSIRPEIAKPLSNGDYSMTFRVCQSLRSSLNAKEKAILAYVIGICFSDASSELVLTESVIRMGHADAAVYSNHSFALFRSGRRSEALRYLETALKMNGSLPQARLHRAVEVSVRRGDITVTLRSALNAMRFMPNQAAIRLIASKALSQYETLGSDVASTAADMAKELEELLRACSKTPCEPPLSPWAEPYASVSTLVSAESDCGTSDDLR